MPPLVGCPLGNVRTLSPMGTVKVHRLGGGQDLNEEERILNKLSKYVKQILLPHGHAHPVTREDEQTNDFSLESGATVFRDGGFSLYAALLLTRLGRNGTGTRVLQ